MTNTKILITSYVSIAALCAANYSGKYKGVLESSGGRRQEVVATFKQEGRQVTGSIGPNPSQQAQIEDAALDSGRFVFRIAPLGGLRFTFLEPAETLTGTLSTITGKPPAFDRVILRRVASLTLADTVPPLPNEGPFRSTRVAQLRKDIEGNPRAVDAFWSEVKKSGAPLVEPDPTDQRFEYATFLWQGKPEHKNVLVMWMPFAVARPADYLMINVPNTDLWFRTVRLPRGARIKYHLSPNDPLGTMPPSEHSRSAVRDPLNPNGNQLELPSAVRQTYYGRRDGIPRMSVDERVINSRRLNQDRRILIYTPPDYDPKSKPYPSIYFFDGEDKDGLVFATSTFENLFADGKIPPMVVVRIVNPSQAARGAQLSDHVPFFDFLSHELVPYVRSNFNVSIKPDETAISGYSLGGFAAVFAGFRHSDLFGLILAQSGSYWLDPTDDEAAEPNWIAQKFIASPRLPLRFYMDAGLFEVDVSGRGSGILLPNRNLRDVLRAKGYRVTYQEFPGGHDYINWRGTLADGLIDLFGFGRSR